jgi:cobyrinic acid a,c-diamide synthase
MSLCLCLLLLQLPGSAHDVAVQGYGFTYDYIDPSFPAAAKVRPAWPCDAVQCNPPLVCNCTW